MQSVVWLTALVLCITCYSNMYGTYIDRVFWNLVSVVTLPLLAWMLSFTSSTLSNFHNKSMLMLFGMVNFIVSRDKSWKGLPDPDLIKGGEVKSKRVIFIRHGESDWNLIFNKGIIKLPFRFVAALLREIFMLFKYDSAFYDSPLNKEGISQAKELARHVDAPPKNEDPKHIEASKAIAVLNGTDSKVSSVIVASNLRRAIATTIIGLWPRLERTGERVHILSQLQEISRNVDTLSLARAGEIPESGRISKAVPKFRANRAYDLSDNKGNKPMFGNGLTRMMAFAEWVFGRDEDVIIVGGHSLYFRFFFKTFLPHNFDHISKKYKIKNSGVIAFTLSQGQSYGKTLYRIDPDSIVEVYKGFDMKKKKK